MVRPLLAAGMCLVLVSCTSWPKPTGVSAPQLPSAQITTIDILPLDLEVWTHNGYARSPDEVRANAEMRIIGATTEGIAQRGYAVNAQLDWSGAATIVGGAPEAALDPEALVATLDSLASYGAAVEKANPIPAKYRSRGSFGPQLPVAFLPAKLGARTGADATLYIGGWGFVGKESDKAATVALVIVGVILVVGIIAIAIASADGKGKGKDSKVVEGIAGAGRGVAKVASSMGRVAAKTAIGAGKVVLRAAPDILDVVDAFGHTGTHVTFVAGGGVARPEYAEDPSLPREGKPEMYLEMTLVDNHTGAVLWHAHERFPANATRPDHVTRAVKSLLATLPKHVAAPVAAR